MKTKPSREKQFDEYFENLYQERWSVLKAALLDATKKTVLKNPFGPSYQDYSLDPASLYPVKYLNVKMGQTIADFCASPGGKSLASIFELNGDAEWICNDLSPARVARLRAVLYDCLPPTVLARIKITRGDASRIGLTNKQQFDRVLVDAPCSGERHLLASPRELARWSLKGVKGLAIRQHALLCSALDSALIGGRVVYSTCAINAIENDGVITKLFKSRQGQFRKLPISEELGEATEHGWILLPDRSGCGPIYFSVLEKIEVDGTAQ